MFREAFNHRSGRVIALGRLVLAVVFLVAIAVDPDQPARFGTRGYPVIEGYLLISAALLVSTWNNWWLSFRLAAPAHALDIAFFIGTAYFTEVLTGNFSSPFFALFTYLLFAATIRWGWRGTILTATVTVLLYAAIGISGLVTEVGDLDPYRIGRRVTYLIIISLLVIWFGMNWQGAGAKLRRWRNLEAGIVSIEPPIQKAVECAASRIGAQRIVFAWWDKEEPWVNVAQFESGHFKEQRFGPSSFGPLVDSALERSVFLFDNRAGRAIMRDREEKQLRVLLIAQPVDPDFAAALNLRTGLAIWIETTEYCGYMFVLDVPGLCVDDLLIGRYLGEEISAAFERASTLALSQETASTRTRLSVARDLHDSVIQLLAGTAFRLEGIRKSAEAGRNIGSEVDALQQELSTEQRELRKFIGELRGDGATKKQDTVRETLETLLERMSRQWNLECDLVRCPPTLLLPTHLQHGLQQLIREAVANAARHGRADIVSVSVDSGESGISLVISDNGGGFGARAGGVGRQKVSARRPWSLTERVHDLGGTLSVHSTPTGSRVIISIPFEAAE